MQAQSLASVHPAGGKCLTKMNVILRVDMMFFDVKYFNSCDAGALLRSYFYSLSMHLINCKSKFASFTNHLKWNAVKLRETPAKKKQLFIGRVKSQIMLVAFAGGNENSLVTTAEHLCCLDYISLDLFGWGGFYPL